MKIARLAALTLLATSGSANATIYQFAYHAGSVEHQRVPDPETWALMLGGFAVAGIASRRRNRTVAA